MTFRVSPIINFIIHHNLSLAGLLNSITTYYFLQDYVVATGETHTVREFVEKSFALVDVEIRWEGSGDNEIGYDSATDKVRVRVSPKYYRPAEVRGLVG